MAINFAVLLHVAVKWNLRGTNIPQKLAMPTLRRIPGFYTIQNVRGFFFFFYILLTVHLSIFIY